VGKTCIVLYELLKQSFHIGNVVIWPQLDWQALSASTVKVGLRPKGRYHRAQ
jgi:hypothetical protein